MEGKGGVKWIVDQSSDATPKIRESRVAFHTTEIVTKILHTTEIALVIWNLERVSGWL
jgi:hypothetical protein